MIVYSATKQQFCSDVMQNEIADKILTSFVRETGHSTGQREVDSWRNSMMFMNNIIVDPEIPDDAGIAIEYKIPQTAKRIDFIITGLDTKEHNVAVLVELKQWSEATMTGMDGIVNTYVGKGYRDCEHPSYQVWSYATLLRDFNSSIEEDDIRLYPCAYLHNYEPDAVIHNEFYDEYLKLAPAFLKTQSQDLRDFIKRYVKGGDKNRVMYLIENGKIRPSKQLADSLSDMLDGNQEFVLIDDQKLVYEIALRQAKESTDEVKNVLIVEGGPGTGKSVVAVNLLVELTNRNQIVHYVTKNSAPREVYEAKLSGKLTKSRINALFRASGSYTESKSNEIDALVVDEAHRLNEKSGMFSNKGENQIKELINASKFSVFFIDEDQKVTLKDIGSKDEIRFWANQYGANITEMDLSSQFRCNGSDGYLAWIDNILQIRDTANVRIDELDYDFRVVDSPQELHDMITQKNKSNNKSRVVAGYCWDWVSKKDASAYDIKIGEYKARWNLLDDGQSWIIKPNSVTEVGCIHTCQGLELDYVGVIIGKDLVIRAGRVFTDGLERSWMDQSIKGFKKLLKEDEEQALVRVGSIIKNTYRTLMTRGMKGCYIYCVDPETQEYFRNALNKSVDRSVFSDDSTGVIVTD